MRPREVIALLVRVSSFHPAAENRRRRAGTSGTVTTVDTSPTEEPEDGRDCEDEIGSGEAGAEGVRGAGEREQLDYPDYLEGTAQRRYLFRRHTPLGINK